MLEERLIASITNEENLRYCLSRGFKSEYLLVPKYRKAFEFCVDSMVKYGSTPTQEILQEVLGIELEGSAEPIGILVDALFERQRKNAASKLLLSAAQELEQDSKQALKKLIEEANSILLSTGEGDNRYDYIAEIDARLAEYERMRGKERQTMGCPTGWEIFDDWTLGLQKGELSVLFGGTGAGKTYLMCRIALGAYSLGWQPVILAYEPTIPSIYRRIDSLAARINPRRYRLGTLSEEERERLVQRLNLLKSGNRPFIIIKPINYTVAGVIEALHQHKRGDDENWVVFIDQLSFLRSRGEKYEFYRNLFSDLINLISPANLNVPCWLLAQENREGMKAKRTELYHIALTSFAEQFADWVINLVRDEETAVLRMLKFREGIPADFPLYFDLNNGVVEVAGIMRTL